MKRTILFAIAALLVAAQADAQLLWKISGGGLAKPSYVIGTHHLASVSFIDKIPGVTEALTETDQVYGELDGNVMTNPDSLAFMQAAMYLPEGKTLKNILTPSQFQKLDKYMVAKMGVGLSSPQVMEAMGRMTPAALLTNLTLVAYMTNHMAEFDPTSSFDLYFQAQAKANNEPVGGLETMQFQANLLYNSTPMERQVQLLECFIDHNDVQVASLEKVTQAFYSQDLDALKAASDEKLGNACDFTPEEDAAICDSRNADWAKKMPAIMQQSPTLFVVGALHLPGSKGLLQLLRDAGYEVEGVK